MKDKENDADMNATPSPKFIEDEPNTNEISSSRSYLHIQYTEDEDVSSTFNDVV